MKTVKEHNNPPLVYIEWKNPENDWHWFYLIGSYGGCYQLKGADYPDGSAKHEGDIFWVISSDILRMISI